MVKIAVLIGCNYPGEGVMVELHGCINDVMRVKRCLIEKYGFLEENIHILIDTDPSFTQPTSKNIQLKLSSVVEMARPGDMIFVHYSGHGTRLVSNNLEDGTPFIQCIVPTDFNPITGNDFRKIVDKVPGDCAITFVADSCHSGGLIQATKEQIVVSTKKERSWFGNMIETIVSLFGAKLIEPHAIHGDYSSFVKNRSMPLSTLINILKLKAGKVDIDEGNVIPTLCNLFKEDASHELKNSMKFSLNKLQNGVDGVIFGMVGKQDTYSRSTRNVIPDRGILLSASQNDQPAIERSFSGNPNEVYGAFSNAILAIIEETHGIVTNRELIMKTTDKLESQQFTQKPGLYCSDHHVDAPFVCDLKEKQVAKMEIWVTGQTEVGKLEKKMEGLEADMEDIEQQWVLV